MAIPFARLQPLQLTARSGAARNIAYTARSAIRDPRFPKAFDYTHLRSDLAYEEIILPENCPAEYLDRSVLATALDGAELQKIRTPLDQRERLPQVGVTLTVALPPKCEVSLREAAEILRRIVIAASGSQPIPIHCAIHDVRINRHGHATFGLRPLDAHGSAGPKLRDFLVRLRVTAPWNGADVVEGIDWPGLTWEIHQIFFHELGIDLVVDPIAPVPGIHLSPIVYSNGSIHNADTRQRIELGREQAHAANARVIEGSPTRLIETLLRGRSTLRIAEIERLCAKFYDGDAEQRRNVERILLDQNVITLAEVPGAAKPCYATTRRIHSMLTRAAGLVGQPGEARIKAVTGADQDSVLGQISRLCATEGVSDAPLILGKTLSDCNAAEAALAPYKPKSGTVDMAVTGPSALRRTGRRRGVCLRPGQLIVVPHAERIDDQRLARLLLATDCIGSKLVLGHDQSCGTGVVRRHLAAYAADQSKRERPLPREDRSNEIVQLLRAGLVRHAIEEMAARDLLVFGSRPNRIEDTSLFVVCDDPRRIDDVYRTIRHDRVRSGVVGKPTKVAGLREDVGVSVGEWIIATELGGDAPAIEGEFAKIVAIDPAHATIDVMFRSEAKRIDLKNGPAIRPATVVSVREARNLFAEAKLAVEVTDPRRVWSALLLVAMRGQNARLYVDPSIAETPAMLVEVARRSLSGALPHQRAVRADPDAAVGKILLDIIGELDFLPETKPIASNAPRPTNAAESVRRLLVEDRNAKLGYNLLYQYVGRHNPDHAANAAHAFSLFANDLTKAIIQFLADIEPSKRVAHDPDMTFDLPHELNELEPERWKETDVYTLKMDLRALTIPGWRCPINPASSLPTRQQNRIHRGPQTP